MDNNKVYNEEEVKQACSSLLKSKDWQVVSTILNEEINSIKDISQTIKEEDDYNGDAIIYGRKIAYNRLNNFFIKLRQYAGVDKKEAERWD